MPLPCTRAVIDDASIITNFRYLVVVIRSINRLVNKCT